jgi:hypothetical protein
MYERGTYEPSDSEVNRQEFVADADQHLRWLRSYDDDKSREETGELEAGYDIESELDLDLPAGRPDASSSLSKRTVARSSALSALNRLRTGRRNMPRAIIHGTHKPRGGVDGTLPQWVIFLGVEAWVPADEVKEAYRAHQQALLAEQASPKTQERAFEVAKFVWEEEREHGERPPWPVLWERWNNWPLTERFKSWRDFHTYFSRGKKAVPPRYYASDEHLTDGCPRSVSDAVQQPCSNPGEYPAMLGKAP